MYKRQRQRVSNSLSVSASDSSDSCHTRYWTWRCTATRASASSALDSFSLVGKRFFDALVRNDCAIGEKRGTVGSDRWPMCVDSAHRKKRRYDGCSIVGRADVRGRLTYVSAEKCRGSSDCCHSCRRVSGQIVGSLPTCMTHEKHLGGTHSMSR